MEFDDRKVSYLCARDPSILISWGPRLDAVKQNLAPLMAVTEEEEKNKQVCVFLRLKQDEVPLSLYEYTDTTLVCNMPEPTPAAKYPKDGLQVTRSFTFSKVFPPESQQDDLFRDIVKPRVLNFLNGLNATLLTYGASGSGKTYTVVGTPTEPGIIPRVLEYLFQTLPRMSILPKVKPLDNGTFCILSEAECKREKDSLQTLLHHPSISTQAHDITTYKEMQQRLSNEPIATLDEIGDVTLGIWVSFTEIYNEQLFDLLEWEPSHNKGRPKLKLCNNNGQTYVKGLKSVYVPSGLEAFQLLQFGLHHLNYAATSVNSHSSRSHCVFSIKLVQAEMIMNHFNICDLAGSERSKRTNNIGDRLKESNNINVSLMVLGRCISIIRDSQKRGVKQIIPFRESKLTQMFQKALTGYEDITMIVNVNPMPSMFDESMHVLNFSAIAKEVVMCPPVRENLKRKHEALTDSADAGENVKLRLQVSELSERLEELQDALLAAHDESEERDSETRREVIAAYDKMLEAEKAFGNKRLQNSITKYKELEQKYNNLRRDYDELSEENEKLRTKRARLTIDKQTEVEAEHSVICLDSSENSENSETE